MRHQTAAELFDDLNRVSRSISDSEAPVKASNSNIWKTAFIALAGISLLSVALIWATSSKQTNPSTLQADSNSQPVQPLNPATGMNEQGLATIVPISQEMAPNSNTPMQMPETLGGSDTNPYWSTGRVPPGAPQQYVPPTGQMYNVGNSNSPFIQDEPTGGNIIRGSDGNYYYVVPPAANANVKASPTPKTTKSPAANTAVQPSPAPNETPKPQTTPTPDVKTNPAKTPAPAPKTNDKPKKTPASTKTAQSGKTQDSE